MKYDKVRSGMGQGERERHNYKYEYLLYLALFGVALLFPFLRVGEIFSSGTGLRGCRCHHSRFQQSFQQKYLPSTLHRYPSSCRAFFPQPPSSDAPLW